MDQLAAFRNVAEVLRAAQRVAIEVENAPEKRKTLRSFSLSESAGLLGVPPADLRALVRARFPNLAPASRSRLSFDQLGTLREVLPVSASPGERARRKRRKGEEAPARIVFTNFKGGSAKTTSSVHFAQFMALAGYRVLFVDLDSQGSATAQFGFDPAYEAGLDQSFAAWTAARAEGRIDSLDVAALCRRTYWPTIDLVPAGAALSAAEEALAKRAASAEAEETLYFDEFNAFLAALPTRYDIVVVDTRPDVNMLMTTALHAATGIVVPTRATMTDLASTGEFFAHLASYMAEFAKAFGAGLQPAFTRILITDFDPTDRSQEALFSLARDRFGKMVLPEPFLHSRILGTAGLGKETLYEYEPTTDRAACQRALNSINAVNRLIERDVLAAWTKASSAKRN
ncbi:AAA family ATPase [Roseomonas aerophila]|uniref:AAA family ATPase n=1 Tax=Teichococcus aerophilus TaxID=1224513 RepID=A0ABR7RPM9_9PROT|nr:AAA family ATPase [Pseudoroseomonas aerophila]